MIVVFFLMALPAVLRLVRFVREPSNIEICIFAVAVFLAALSQLVASLDCAQPLYTAFIVREPGLVVLFSALVVSIALMIVLRWRPWFTAP